MNNIWHHTLEYNFQDAYLSVKMHDVPPTKSQTEYSPQRQAHISFPKIVFPSPWIYCRKKTASNINLILKSENKHVA